MTLLRRLASVARWVLHRKKAEAELDEELQVFIDMAASQKMRDGVPPAEARRLAALELGGVEQAKEQVRTRRHGALLDEFGRDLRHAVRMFGQQPGFIAVIVLTLALGIGANTAIFSLMDALMLRWLPVPNPQQLVQLALQSSDPGGTGDAFSYAIVRGLAEHDEIFAGVGAFNSSSFNVGPAGSVGRVPGAYVSGGFYETLGLIPVAGRLLGKEDDEPGAPLVGVLSYGYWERQFAHNPGAIGQTIPVNGVPVTIVGVTPPGFAGVTVGAVADLTLPVASIARISPRDAGLLGPGNFWLRILARPNPDLSIAQARARLASVWPQTAEQVVAAHWPPTQKKLLADAVFEFRPGGTGYTYLRSLYTKPLQVLMGMVAIVLLIACANVASLLLARATARHREMAVRLAMGAGRFRIIRQLLTESLLLSFMGGACGVGLAWISGRFLLSTLSLGPFPVTFDLTPNLRVLAFAAAVAIATGILFGIAPAFQATATGPSAVLKQGARATTSRSRLLPSLVSAQVALTLVLLIGASLFVRTLQNLQNMDPGFNRTGVLLVDFAEHPRAAPSELLDDVRQTAGVSSASLSTHTPLSGSYWSEPAVPHGQPLPERDTALFVGAGPGFFETMQITLMSGRGFTPRDNAAGTPVAVISEAYAERFFPNQNPLGRHLSARVRGTLKDLEIVGVAKNTNAIGLRRPPRSTVYVAQAQLTGDVPTTMEIRVNGSIRETAARIQNGLQAKLKEGPVEVHPLSAQVEAAMSQERVMATLASAFGFLALVLACVGLYGLLAYRVTRRTQEIGIRMALGARRSQVVAMVLQGAAGLVLSGIALGLPAAWATSRWIEAMLFQLKPTDPFTIGGAILLLTIVSLAAAYLPARRASRVDPITALRHE
jgi:putative ABC transport system permease protein